MNNKTFGEFVKYIKQSRNLSASKLAALTGNKSKTSVLRIMENQCSHKTMVRFAKVLDSAVVLTEDERDEINRLLRYDNITQAHSDAMDNLKFLYTKDQIPESDKMRCVSVNSKPPKSTILLENLFDVCHNGKCTIIIENVLSIELVKALHTHIRLKGGESNARILHFFCDDDNIVNKSIMAMCLFKLAPYRNYYPYECERELSMPKRILIMWERENAYEMRFVSFAGDNEFYFTDTPVTKEFYDHMLTIIEYRKKNSNLIIKQGESGEQLAEVMSFMGHMDKKTSVQVEAGACYMLIPFEIQQKLYEDSGWLGLGKDHPTVRKLYKIMKERMDYIENHEISRKFIWTEDGLGEFMKTGRTCDHFKPVRGLNIEECKVVIRKTVAKPGNEIRILKPEYCLNETEFHIFGDKHLVASDSYHGWWEEFSTVVVNDKRVVRLVSDFYHNELWEKYCYDNEKSIEIINNILNQY